jgi:glycosyltransferase involved in cell wall biosynthesis
MKVTFVIPVNNPALYARMENSAGKENCLPQYNATSAASALNKGIKQAKTDIVVCCHQDVVFPKNWLDRLERQIEKVADPNWGVLGTFGIGIDGLKCGHITGTIKNWLKDPRGQFRIGILPKQAMTLDEHCLILRKSSGLRFDEQLGGWHFYGADICLEAAKRGMKNYVIDARVYHGGKASMGTSFEQIKKVFAEKWRGNRNPYRINGNPLGYVITTCAQVIG